MRYRQVYGRGPMEEREPLYHSDPFFMEVNGEAGRDFVYGIYIDNPSETVLDMLSFPSRLLVDNDFVKDPDGGYDKTPVMRIWNLYSYNLHKAAYHGLNNLECRNNKRNFIVGRGCFTGMPECHRSGASRSASDV